MLCCAKCKTCNQSENDLNRFIGYNTLGERLMIKRLLMRNAIDQTICIDRLRRFTIDITE